MRSGMRKMGMLSPWGTGATRFCAPRLLPPDDVDMRVRPKARTWAWFFLGDDATPTLKG